MRSLKYLFLIFSLFLQISCNNKELVKLRLLEYNKASDCSEKWIYKDLKKEKQIKVLLFDARWLFDLMAFPNFLIGTTLNGDTIACMDNKFEGSIKEGEVITILPYQWTDNDKKIEKPISILYKKVEKSMLKCKIDTVFYCKIDSCSVKYSHCK